MVGINHDSNNHDREKCKIEKEFKERHVKKHIDVQPKIRILKRI